MNAPHSLLNETLYLGMYIGSVQAFSYLAVFFFFQSGGYEEVICSDFVAGSL